MNINSSKVLKELNAYIDQAWGVERFAGEKTLNKVLTF